MKQRLNTHFMKIDRALKPEYRITDASREGR
jgi:hypothetical protein